MNYLGCKRRLLPFIDECLAEYGCANVASVADLFAGTGCVATHFARRPGVVRLLVNDVQAYSLTMLRARLLQGPGRTESLLPSVPPPPKTGFFARHYAGTYFTPENARRIDGWLAVLGPDDHYARACLIEAVARVSNTACVYESYLKQFKRSALSALTVRPLSGDGARPKDVTFLNQRAEDIDLQKSKFDLVYLDPPYNARKYSTNYHVFETIARGDAPKLCGVAGVRADATASATSGAFNSKRGVAAALAAVLTRCVGACRYLAVSYNSEGLLPRDRIAAALVEAGFADVRVFEMAIPRFASRKVSTSGSSSVIEYLFVAKGTLKKNVGPEHEHQGVAQRRRSAAQTVGGDVRRV